MGGYVALSLARRHRQRVRSLILVGTSAGGPDSVPVPDDTMSAWQAAAELPPAEFARRTMPLSFAPGWTAQHPAAFEDLLAARLQHPTAPAAWAAQFAACQAFLDTCIDVESIEQPALVIHGTADGVVPLRNGEILARRLPRGELATVEGGGHLYFLEDTSGFCRRATQFLNTVKKDTKHA